MLEDMSCMIIQNKGKNIREDAIVGTFRGEIVYQGPRNGFYIFANKGTPKAYKRYLFKEQVDFTSFYDESLLAMDRD